MQYLVKILAQQYHLSINLTSRPSISDIVLGYASEMECIHKLKDRLQNMAEQMVELAQTKR